MGGSAKLALFGASLALLAPIARADDVRVVDDVVDGDLRTALVVIETGDGDCVDASALASSATLTPLTSCLVRVVASAEAAITFHTSHGDLAMPSPPADVDPIALAAGAGPGEPGSMRVIPTPAPLHVGVIAIAAIVLVTDDRGRPTSTVPLRVVSERGRIRGLAWPAPGVGIVRLLVDAPMGSVDVTVHGRRGLSESVEVPVAPAPPTRVVIEAPERALAGAEIEAHAIVHTEAGVRFAEEDVRVVVQGARVVAQVRLGDRWVPIAAREVAIETPVVTPPPPRVVSRRPRAPRGDVLGWHAALRGVVDDGGDLGLGASVAVLAALGELLALAGQVGWGAIAFERDAAQPLTAHLSLVQHTFEALAFLCVRSPQSELRWIARLGGGLAVTYGVGTIDARDTSSVVGNVLAAAAVGARFDVGALELGLDLALRLYDPLADAVWTMPHEQVSLEVGLGRLP